MLSFFESLCINTFVLSYTGQLDLGEAEAFMESMHLYSGGNRGLIVNAMSAGLEWVHGDHGEFSTPRDEVRHSRTANGPAGVPEQPRGSAAVPA